MQRATEATRADEDGGLLAPLLRAMRTSYAAGANAPPPRPGARRGALSPAQAEPPRRRLKIRTLWISDIHLGTRDCKADYLLDLLAHTDCEQIYLVGDIIDFWNLKSGWYWPAAHSRVLQTIMARAGSGVEVVYVPGNHDELLRDYAGSLFGGVRIATEAIHETADGRRFLVKHGDEFDAVVKHSRWLAMLGSRAYDFLLYSNRWVNAFRRRLGFPYWSLAAYLKERVKNAVKFISQFEIALAQEARRNRVDGVICGHIHKPLIEDVAGVRYCNDGDWVESCTALVERDDGSLAIVHWGDDVEWLSDERDMASARALPEAA
jgi:UDP-2,3-diacylglucosamine pyrophosphatase LpxH